MGHRAVGRVCVVPIEREGKFASTFSLSLLLLIERSHALFQGAFVFKNQMIDMPTVKQAKNLLDVINKIEKVDDKSPDL